MQEYLGNLFYLFFHQVSAGPGALQFPVSTYEFTGKLPEYDENKNVWRNTLAPDRFDKKRWLVSDPEESVNLKGLASSMRTLRTKSSPILLLVLPVNRKFYEYYGLDMSEFDNKYEAIRNTIKNLARGSNVHLIDLLESPQLRQGFEDRMHMDQYGNFQIARFILEIPEYRRFIDGVRNYYDEPAMSHSVEPADSPASRKSVTVP